MSIWHLDFETYSECDIKLGSYRYASDPTTRVLFCALSRDDEPPVLWDSKIETEPPGIGDFVWISKHPFYGLLDQMLTDNGPIYAHNAPFEIAICHYLFMPTFDRVPPDLSRWRCTAAMCRRAAIPWSLAGASEFLGLAARKSTVGRRLINLFSMPHSFPKTGIVVIDKQKVTFDEAWKMFGEYCLQDVVVERELHGRLSEFELKGTTLKAFQFDLLMNHRGIPVNVAALVNAQKVVENFNREIGREFRKLTGLNISQTGEVLKKFQSWGYPEDNLQGTTLDTYVDDIVLEAELLGTEPHKDLTKAVELRRAHSYAAVKKVPAMLAAVCSDGTVKGAFMWSGAIRTHRWAGRLIQPHNFKRPKFSDTALAISMIKAGCTHEDLSLMWGAPLEVIASSIRHFVQHPRHDIIDADFSSIEARVAPWLAGQNDMLDEFRRGEGLYENMAAAIFDISPREVTADQRFVGKTAALGCQFGMSWKKFQSSCEGYGRKLDDKICQMAVFKYRKKRDKIVQAWKDLQNNAIVALNRPGEEILLNDKLSLIYGRIGGFPALMMTLPSGHKLVYPEPEVVSVKIETDIIEEDVITGELVLVHKEFFAEQISFYGQLPMSQRWGRIITHGGKLFENAVQAVAGDFMTHALLRIEEAGFKPFATIHDQALSPFERGRGGTTGDIGILTQFKKAFCAVPKWATDFPLEATVKVTPFYQKD